MKFVIKGRLDGLNEYTRANRSNRYAGAELKKYNQHIVSIFIPRELKGKMIEKAELHFKWYEENKRRDLDNICFAKKFILDALVDNWVLKDDGWKNVIGFYDKFYVDKDNPRIEVEIIEHS